MVSTIKLTQFSHGAGCGCKIAPAVLETILASSLPKIEHKNLLVGYGSKDDAAAYDMGNGQAIISTTDFFTPIVDDAVAFGKIASANAISDVYAMGGKPLMAIAILGWPVNTLPAALAAEVLEGARSICAEAGIPLAGGHSIDSTEPIFGLAVTGITPIANLKKNNTAKQGDVLFVTKPIGVGILATAQKRDALEPQDLAPFIDQLTTLNKVGEILGGIPEVHALTDITGFGLLGHLIEMAEGSELSAHIFYSKIKMIEAAKKYLAQRMVPDATYRNWNSYSTKTSFDPGVNVMEAFSMLPDPQTNGGLLVAVDPTAVDIIKDLFTKHGLADFIEPIGVLEAVGEKVVVVKN
jgi:selenide,water dikinase